MSVLYFHTLYAPARLAHLALLEKHREVTVQAVEPWAHDPEFLALNPAGEVPVLVEADGTVVAGHLAICEYLEETHDGAACPALIPGDAAARAEVRRLLAWFDRKFAAEVTDLLAGEKLLRRHVTGEAPDSQAVRAGRRNIHTHLSYIDFLIERRRWLAGEDLSLADLAAGAHLSLVDYLGDVPWEDHAQARDWYARLKSRPCMREVLSRRIGGIPPAPHYDNPDF